MRIEIGMGESRPKADINWIRGPLFSDLRTTAQLSDMQFRASPDGGLDSKQSLDVNGRSAKDWRWLNAKEVDLSFRPHAYRA
jgi:hypothetical protein